MAAKTKKSDPFTVSTLREVAAFFHVPFDSVKTGWRGAGMPGRAGAWKLSDIAAWREKNRRQSTAPDVDSKSGSLAHRKAIAEATIAEENARAKKFKNDSHEGLVVNLAEAKLEVRKMFTRVKNRLEALPDELEMGFPSETRSQNKARAANTVNLLLQEMAAWSLKPDLPI